MIAVFLFAITVASASPAVDPMDAVVLLQTGNSSCAGAIVEATGRIATAYHCVASGGRPRITTRSGRRTTGRVSAVNVAADLAIIDAPELAGEAMLGISPDVPVPGDALWVLGHPFGSNEPLGYFANTLRWSVSAGIVANVGPRAIQFTAPVNPGNSGGPAIDDQDRIVAVVSRRLTGDGMGFGAPSQQLTDLLNKSPRKLRPFGGTVALELYGTMWEGWTLSVGVRGEFAVRDRVFVNVGGALPVSAVRWNAVRFGKVSWSVAEACVGLRQRLFSARWTTRLNIYGGVIVLNELTMDDDFHSLTVAKVGPLVGGSFTLRNLGLDLAWTPAGGGGIRGLAVVRWPGVVSVF
ncbi:MAG: trypsin-like peptidase domain-containing protein [Proteobacteria bacterium]|jgi:hypothetical protein|nr:trypsin-like peptidase domain-containing protein [Pseudomonadota bacterium]